jgi:3-oxoacyl-[acyl-carrier-protein] synthase III
LIRPLGPVHLHADGSAARLFQALLAGGKVSLAMDGAELANRAVRVLAASVRDVARRYGLTLADLAAVVVHAGKGRIPALLARALGFPEERIRSETPRTGNLGSVSLLAAWAGHDDPEGPVVWAAVGAGLTWGAVLLDSPGAPGVPPAK